MQAGTTCRSKSKSKDNSSSSSVFLCSRHYQMQGQQQQYDCDALPPSLHPFLPPHFPTPTSPGLCPCCIKLSPDLNCPSLPPLPQRNPPGRKPSCYAPLLCYLPTLSPALSPSSLPTSSPLSRPPRESLSPQLSPPGRKPSCCAPPPMSPLPPPSILCCAAPPCPPPDPPSFSATNLAGSRPALPHTSH